RREASAQRKSDAVVVGNTGALNFRDGSEAWIWRGQRQACEAGSGIEGSPWTRAGPQIGGGSGRVIGQQTGVAERVHARILYGFVIAVIADVVNRERRLLAETLLQFQVPLFISGIADSAGCGHDAWRGKQRVAGLNARQRAAILECTQKRSIRG